MEERSARRLRAAIVVLSGAGIALLLWWAGSLYAYGVYVDEHGLVGTVRTVDAILFASAVSCVALALGLLIVLTRRLRR